jgi:hypothetical protein
VALRQRLSVEEKAAARLANAQNRYERDRERRAARNEKNQW